jgi:hypothetical protein
VTSPVFALLTSSTTSVSGCFVSTTVNVSAVFGSATVTAVFESVKPGASLSVIVAVCWVIAPLVAFVGSPIVTTTSSLPSTAWSSMTVIVMSLLVWPAVIVIGVAVIV